MRRLLVDAAVGRAMTRAAKCIDAARLEQGTAEEALRRLVDTSWAIVANHGALLEAARTELAPDVLREHHAPIAKRIGQLVQRGQRDGSFDADFTGDWLLGAFFALLHAAAEQRLQGRDERVTADALGALMLKVFRAARREGGDRGVARGDPSL